MIKLIQNPTKLHLQEIEVWLKNEYKSNEGFYCNWNIIEESFHEHQLYFFTKDNVVIGFVCWYIYEIMVRIDIIEVSPNYRNIGYGKMMVNLCINEFQKKGMVVVEGESVNDSESFWEKLGFTIYEMSTSYSNNKMFKPLIDVLQHTEETNHNSSGIKIELWNKEPYESKDKLANWCWLINSNKSKKSIIYPANQNWRIKVSCNDIVVFDGKIKHRKDYDSIYSAGFLYITNFSNLIVTY